jgi:hypothetical protein
MNIPEITSLEDIFKLVDEHTQVTAQDLINRRLYLKGEGWGNITLSDDFSRSFAENISQRLGGRSHTKEAVKRAIMWRHPQHWGLSRFILQQYKNGAPFIGYVAGQDQQWESNVIRTYLKNL